MQYFILVATVTMITETVSISFPISLATIVKEKNSFNPIMQLINLKSPKKWSQTSNRRRLIKKDCHKVASSTPLLRTQNQQGQNVEKNFFVGISLTFVKEHFRFFELFFQKSYFS